MKHKLTLLTALFLAVAAFTTNAIAGKPVPTYTLVFTCVDSTEITNVLDDGTVILIGCSSGTSNIQFDGTGYPGTVILDVVDLDGYNANGFAQSTSHGVLGPVQLSLDHPSTWTVTVSKAHGKGDILQQITVITN